MRTLITHLSADDAARYLQARGIAIDLLAINSLGGYADDSDRPAHAAVTDWENGLDGPVSAEFLAGRWNLLYRSGSGETEMEIHYRRMGGQWTCVGALYDAACTDEHAARIREELTALAVPIDLPPSGYGVSGRRARR